ncbi:MAG TPA: hypothetical protein VFG42_25725 [Baekduia sp.]|uniref:hypothetical protein n=1 Tax=Baekduia sp. TaxID=2600305 RepID=UPI002D77D3A0|nr:hypothetical protein [Baekduia sp.]HET6510218.1 hypothetical protein [Baekduia sp.]
MITRIDRLGVEPPSGDQSGGPADEQAAGQRARRRVLDHFAPDHMPEDIAEIAQRLRKQAGLPDAPTGDVASDGSRFQKLKDAVTPG